MENKRNEMMRMGAGKTSENVKDKENVVNIKLSTTWKYNNDNSNFYIK